MDASMAWAEHRERVQADWVDAHGALSPAYAVVIFDHAIDLLYNGIGLREGYRTETSFSTFTLETHVLHEHPAWAGDDLVVRSRVLEVDTKRMHIVQEMFRAGEETRRLALMEQLAIHVDLAIRRSAPFPPERLAQIRQAMAVQADWPAVAGTGRRISLATA